MDKPPIHEPPLPPPRYLALGDSYTIGESVTDAERFPALLTARLQARGMTVGDTRIIARTGWTTDELDRAMDAAAPQGVYDLVTLLIGVNNQYRGRDADSYRPEFAKLLRRAIELAGHRPARVIVVSIPDWGVTPFGRNHKEVGQQIDSFNAVNREEAERSGVRYVDVTPISREAERDSALVAEDGLHPSGKMYARWVDLILPQALAALGL
jgi:lysophospholipase L1-like esterase